MGKFLRKQWQWRGGKQSFTEEHTPRTLDRDVDRRAARHFARVLGSKRIYHLHALCYHVAVFKDDNNVDLKLNAK